MSSIFHNIFSSGVFVAFCISSHALALISKSFGHSFVITQSKARYQRFTKY
jgi:hypothetical protein